MSALGYVIIEVCCRTSRTDLEHQYISTSQVSSNLQQRLHTQSSLTRNRLGLLRLHFTMSSESGSESMAGFRNLPAELRNKIYENRVLFRNGIGEREKLSVTDFRVRHQQLIPLILADKQIGNEILPVFFGENTLHLVDKRSRCQRELLNCFADGNIPEQNDRRDIVHYSIMECGQCLGYLSRHGRVIELPPHKWRHMFNHVKLTLLAPERKYSLASVFHSHSDPHRYSTEDCHMWHHQNVDWLYPVRELKVLGFNKLHLLEIEIKPKETHPTSDQLKTLETWVKEKIIGMQIDAMEIRCRSSIGDAALGQFCDCETNKCFLTTRGQGWQAAPVRLGGLEVSAQA